MINLKYKCMCHQIKLKTTTVNYFYFRTMIFKVLTTLLTLVLVVHCEDETEFELCPSAVGTGEVLAVRVVPCTKQGNACILRRNHEVQIEIDFKPSVDTTVLQHQVHGIIGGFPMPYLGLEGIDACAKIDPVLDPCSLQAGTTYHYKSTMKVLPSYPAIGLKVRWQLIGPVTPDKNVQVCVNIPVQIGD